LTAQADQGGFRVSDPARVPGGLQQPSSAREMPSCQCCRWWLSLGRADLGLCRRYPPQVQTVVGFAAWPQTTRLDACGEYARQNPTEPDMQWPLRRTEGVPDASA
jgi:hypothetical protein